MRGAKRRFTKASVGPADRTPSFDLSHAFDLAAVRRDSDVSSLCSSRPSSAGGRPPSAAPATAPQPAAALRTVNSYLASHCAPITLKPPLPAARDILEAFRFLLSGLGWFPADRALEEDVLFLLPLLGCPFKLTRATFKNLATPHYWPQVASVLHWLTLLASVADHLAASPPPPSTNDLLLYLTHSYSLFLNGDDDDVTNLDEEYHAKARSHAAAAAAATNALEHEAGDLEARLCALTTGPSRCEALEAERAVLAEDVKKFQKVVDSWGRQMATMEAQLADDEKELEAKEREGRRLCEENEELRKRIDTQEVNVHDAERMKRELQAVERDIAEAEKGRNTLEEKAWEVESSATRKLDELEILLEQCNQAVRKLKLGTDFHYVLDAKGSSPAQIIGVNYKSILKPALRTLAEDTKKLSVSKLEESIALQEQSGENAKTIEQKKGYLAVLQTKIDESEARLNSVKNEMQDYTFRYTTDAEHIREELRAKEHQLNTVEKEAEELLKNSEQKLQSAVQESDEEVQMCAGELLALIDTVTEYKEFMESTISGMKTDLLEFSDVLGSQSASLSSGGSIYNTSIKRARCPSESFP